MAKGHMDTCLLGAAGLICTLGMQLGLELMLGGVLLALTTNSPPHLSPHSHLQGSRMNPAQICGMLGQQTLNGARILPRGGRGRVLSHYEVGSLDPAAYGFIFSCYGDGLSPQELFFHAQGGREVGFCTYPYAHTHPHTHTHPHPHTHPHTRTHRD